MSRREIASLAIGLAGAILFGVAISNLLDAGTCGSGTPFEELQQCPDDTSLWAILVSVGFVIWMGGLFIGERGLVEPGAGQILWTLFFAGTGCLVLAKALFQSSLDADAELGAYIVAGVLIPMGLAVGIAGLVQLRRR